MLQRNGHIAHLSVSAAASIDCRTLLAAKAQRGPRVPVGVALAPTSRIRGKRAGSIAGEIDVHHACTPVALALVAKAQARRVAIVRISGIDYCVNSLSGLQPQTVTFKRFFIWNSGINRIVHLDTARRRYVIADGKGEANAVDILQRIVQIARTAANAVDAVRRDDGPDCRARRFQIRGCRVRKNLVRGNGQSRIRRDVECVIPGGDGVRRHGDSWILGSAAVGRVLPPAESCRIGVVARNKA